MKLFIIIALTWSLVVAMPRGNLQRFRGILSNLKAPTEDLEIKKLPTTEVPKAKIEEPTTLKLDAKIETKQSSTALESLQEDVETIVEYSYSVYTYYYDENGERVYAYSAYDFEDSPGYDYGSPYYGDLEGDGLDYPDGYGGNFYYYGANVYPEDPEDYSYGQGYGQVYGYDDYPQNYYN